MSDDFLIFAVQKIKNNMRTNWSETQLAYFELCKLLKSVGYKQGSDKFFVIHNEDYVYDEDPDHPESHKKGEISVYNWYHKNNNDDINYYELPTLEEINNWLLKEKRFYVCLTITDGRYFDYNIYAKVDGIKFDKYKLSVQGGNKYTSPDDAYINAFTRILRFLKQIRSCGYIISNSFYGCYDKENW